MLTTKGRALYTYLEHNASKEQINGIVLFLALTTGIRFSDLRRAMNFTSIRSLKEIFGPAPVDEEEYENINDIEAGITVTIKLKPEVDEDKRILCRDILRDGHSFFQTIEDLKLTTSDCIITRKAL